MKVLQKMERNPDAALSEILKKQTILNGFSAPNKLPHRCLQHLGTILHDQVKDPNFGVERIFSRVREELTKYNPESKFEYQTRMIPSTSGPSANVVFENLCPKNWLLELKMFCLIFLDILQQKYWAFLTKASIAQINQDQLC